MTERRGAHAQRATAVWRVPLPRGAEPPYRVFVNGVPQAEGSDFRLVGRELHFERPLAREGRLGALRWASMFLGLAGTYRKNDSVDLQYTLHGTPQSATALEILSPEEAEA